MKNNGFNRFANKLVPSDRGVVSGGFAIEERFIELCDLYKRVKFENLVPPSHLDSAMYLWRTMRIRHKTGDFRHTADELKAMKQVAQWTVDVKRELCDQPKIVLDL